MSIILTIMVAEAVKERSPGCDGGGVSCKSQELFVLYVRSGENF